MAPDSSIVFCGHLLGEHYRLARISQAFPSRAGQESVKYESAQYLSGDGVLKHIEVYKDEQTRSLPAIGSRSRNKLEKCGLGSIPHIPCPRTVLSYYWMNLRFSSNFS